MDGPVWSFLLGRAPIRHAVQRRVRLAVDEAWRTAENVLARERARHRDELGVLARRVVELETANRDLHEALSRRGRRPPHEQEAE